MAIEVGVVCHSFDIGGTGKTAAAFALHHDRARVHPRAIALVDPGARAAELEAAGIEVACAHRDPRRLAALLSGVEVVHVHRPGLAEPIVPEACKQAKVATLVETNVFGWRDTSADESRFSAHLLISQMCAMRYRQQAGLELESFHRRHRTLYYPVDVDALRSQAVSRSEAHALLGLDPARPTVVRVGRDDDRKWGDILVAMVPHLLRMLPEAQVVLVGATAHRQAQLRRLGVLNDVICLSPSSDPHRLACFYGAADVLASASSIGESFGLAIAEALALGIPVVSSSTPWVDNAQVEVIDNGVNGWIANHPRAFAEAVADLLNDRARREAFGAAGAAKAAQRWHPADLTRELERLFESLLATGAPPSDWVLELEELSRFEADYPRRATAQYRPLSPQERRQAGRAVLRERMGWVGRDLRARPVANARMLVQLGVGRLRRWAGSGPRGASTQAR
jgi:glycosyltransferase involved in cell wall biosynthesis